MSAVLGQNAPSSEECRQWCRETSPLHLLLPVVYQRRASRVAWALRERPLLHLHDLRRLVLAVWRLILDDNYKEFSRPEYDVWWVVYYVAKCYAEGGESDAAGRFRADLIDRGKDQRPDPFDLCWACLTTLPTDMLSHLESFFTQTKGLRKEQASLVRCAAQDVFDPSPLDGNWRTPTVAQIADDIYQKGSWDELPVLADALEDAGATVENSGNLLLHLRGESGCGVCEGAGTFLAQGPKIRQKVCRECEGTGAAPVLHSRACWAIRKVRQPGGVA